MKHWPELFAFDSSSTTTFWGVSLRADADWLLNFNSLVAFPLQLTTVLLANFVLLLKPLENQSMDH
jgi:hypothetical protein